MKILYAIQATGNGHIARARDIVPLLKEKHEVDVLISGIQGDIDVPFPVKYKYYGLSFIFGKNGGVDIFETYQKSKLQVLFREIQCLPVQHYDIVINDFEPVSAWACHLRNKDCISLSHQAAVLNKKAPKCLKKDIIGKAILKNYAPSTIQYGFHFKAYDNNIFTPVIRRQVREERVENKGHYTVYLPSYSDEKIIKVLSEFKDIKWEVFSKHNKKAVVEKNIVLKPLNNDAFIKSMATAEGVLCGAGFETPAEALFLKKKLMVIPMKGQYEQQCNAAALEGMGVPVIKSLKHKHSNKIKKWLESDKKIKVDYPDITSDILDNIIAAYRQSDLKIPMPAQKVHTYNKFRDLSLRKIMTKLAG